jgi:7,8-dihydroneopterin aldolase/epimerase/oxygenase
METKISVVDAEFLAYHGYYETERLIGHTFLVTVTVDTVWLGGEVESIKDTVNYEKIYQVIKEEMEIPRQLIESVVNDILKKIKNQCSNVLKCYVKVEKIGPQLGGKVSRTVIEMTA